MTERWAFRLYNGLLLLLLPLIFLFVALRWRRRVFTHGSQRVGDRFGRLAPAVRERLRSGGTWWWVHAVSIGEAKAIETFLRRAPQRAGVRIFLTAVTPEALAWAEKKRLADVVAAAPFDLPGLVRRVFGQVRPEVFISVESEFWPNLLREARRSGARVALINGRLSERSFRSYARVRALLPALWNCLDVWAVRQSQDQERFAALGVPAEKIHVTGNLKYDLSVEAVPAQNAGGATGADPVLVIGSSREGEEAQLVPVMEALRHRWPGLRIIWAPRHIERAGEIETLLASKGWACGRRTAGKSLTNGTRDLLWDSMGELLEAYRQADVALIGGSFVKKGGQNPIEPAALHVPVVFGPSMDNFHGIAEVLVERGGARQVSLPELEACLSDLFKNDVERRQMGERAREAVEAHQGATDKTLKLLEGLRHARA